MGGGSIPVEGLRPETAVQELNAIYAAASSLNNDLQGDLQYALMLFNSNPALLKVYNLLRSHSWQITFKIDPTLKPDQHAVYITDQKAILFRTEEGVQVQFLEEELIHAAQHVYYGDKMLNKYNNFEFEAKLYRDVAGFFSETGGTLFLTMNLPNSMIKEYTDWIADIINRSNISFTESDLQKYFKFLSASTLPGVPNLDMSPLLLIALIYNLKF